MTSLSARKAAVLVALAAGFLIVSTQIQLAQQPAQQPGPGAAAAGQRGGRATRDQVQQPRPPGPGDDRGEVDDHGHEPLTRGVAGVCPAMLVHSTMALLSIDRADAMPVLGDLGGSPIPLPHGGN